jgi:hypothetical protein
MLENLNPAQKVETSNDFRAAVQLEGDELTATLPVGRNDWEQFLEEQGFDPAQFEVIGTPRVSKWQTYHGDWLSSYRFHFRRISQSTNLGLLWRTAKRNSKSSKPLLRVSDKALVVMLSDFQIGKSDHRGGLEEQLERIFQAYDNLEKLFAKNRYAEVILCDMGDIVEGFSNKADMQQLYSNQASIMDQVDIAASLIWDVVKRAAKHSPKVTFATVASNHCQFRVNKQQVGMPGNDDWGIFIAKQINKLAKETELDLQVLIPEAHDESLAYDVFGDSFHVLGLWHGHQSARPEAVPTWWEKQAFGQQPVAAASIALTGHFHHLRVQELGLHNNGGSRYWIQGKTMDNGSGWFRLNSGQDSQPGLVTFELSKGEHFTGTVKVV